MAGYATRPSRACRSIAFLRRSGLEATNMAAAQVMSGQSEAAIGGGVGA